jgi:hypothetical protein
MSATAPAEAAELIEIGLRVRFRHPLVRTAAYRAVTPADRRAAHRALALVLTPALTPAPDPASDPISAPGPAPDLALTSAFSPAIALVSAFSPAIALVSAFSPAITEASDRAADLDRLAWHRAHAADEAAAELVAAAHRAQRRGGAAAAAEFLRRATELTPDPATCAARALDAAEAELRCGAFEIALKLLVTADEGPAGEHAGPGSRRHRPRRISRSRPARRAGRWACSPGPARC